MRNAVLVVAFCLVALLAFRLGAVGSLDNSNHVASAANNEPSQTAQAAQPDPAQQEAKATDDGLPQCDSKSAKDSIRNTIENGAYSNAVKLQVVDMDGLAEVSYDEQAQVRACIGKVTLNSGEGNISYKFLHAKSDPSQVIITLLPISFKLPDVAPDKAIDASVKDAFQGTWKTSAGDITLTFNGNYMTLVGTDTRICRILNYERGNASERVAFISYCRAPTDEKSVDFDSCKSHEVPSITSRGGMNFHTYSESFICHAIDSYKVAILSDGSLQLSDENGLIAQCRKVEQ